MGKVFVELTAKHELDGKMQPLTIKWLHGRVFEIYRILYVRMAGSLKGGRQGMRYTYRIRGKEIYLFCDDGRWFVETD